MMQEISSFNMNAFNFINFKTSPRAYWCVPENLIAIMPVSIENYGRSRSCVAVRCAKSVSRGLSE